VRHDAEIHGQDGLRGVEGLPRADSDSVRARIASDNHPAIEAIAAAIGQTWDAGAGAKVTVVATGPLTNIALFVSVYPHLLDAIERIVFMGGGIGIGNRSAVAGAGQIRNSVFLEAQLLLRPLLLLRSDSFYIPDIVV
jgi:uridine nucleosidase